MVKAGLLGDVVEFAEFLAGGGETLLGAVRPFAEGFGDFEEDLHTRVFRGSKRSLGCSY